jgi:hypothetical protein
LIASGLDGYQENLLSTRPLKIGKDQGARWNTVPRSFLIAGAFAPAFRPIPATSNTCPIPTDKPAIADRIDAPPSFAYNHSESGTMRIPILIFLSCIDRVDGTDDPLVSDE